MKTIATFMKVGVATVVGGGLVAEDEKMLRSGENHVVIGTPGRIYHMLENGSLGKPIKSVIREVFFPSRSHRREDLRAR